MSVSPIKNAEPQSAGALSVSATTLRWLRWAALAAPVVLLALFLATAHKRLHYPFELEWVEDGNLQELSRVANHQPLYVPPSLDYVPYLYAPLFFWLSALAAKTMGVGFAAMRMVSTLATLGVLGGLFALVYLEFPNTAAWPDRRVPRLLAASLAVGFFLSAYPVTFSFFDFGRVDMLCLCFAMLALLAGRRGYPVLAAVLWACSFQTKQGVLPVALLALCFEWQRPRRILLGLGSFVLLAGTSVALLNRNSGGWYWRYVFGMAGGFPLLKRQVGFFLPSVILTPFGLAVALALAALLLAPPHWRSRVTSFYVAGGLGMVLFTWYIYAHAGASWNSVLPAYLYLAIVAGLGAGRLYERLGRSQTSGASAAQALLLVSALMQMGMHLYTPNNYYPTTDEQEQVGGLIADLRKLPGDVLVFDHAQYAVLAGHRQFANGEAALAMLLIRNGQISAGLHQSYAEAIDQRKFSAIAFDDDPEPEVATSFWMPPGLLTDYPVKVQLAQLSGVFMTPRPVLLYMPCPGPDHPDPRRLFPTHLVDESRCPAQ